MTKPVELKPRTRNEKMIHEVYFENRSVSEVARENAISTERARQIFRRAGYPPVSRWRAGANLREPKGFTVRDGNVFNRILEDKRAGKSWGEIAERYGAQSRNHAIKAMKYHCGVRGIPWPIESVTAKATD